MTGIRRPVDSSSDVELLDRVRASLYTPVIGDVLDTLGRTHQFLPSEIRAIEPSMRLVGRAMPVLMHDVYERPKRAFGLMTQALDQVQPGEIYVALTGRSPAAAWGEIMTATARTRGGVGALIDGHHRDTPAVLAQNWPVFSRGSYGLDAGPRAVVVDYRVPVEIGGVLVRPGDLIFADVDGVVVVPHDVEAQALELAFVKAAAENVVRAEIESGMSSTAAYEKYGIL